jgi:hypothetical protein
MSYATDLGRIGGGRGGGLRMGGLHRGGGGGLRRISGGIRRSGALRGGGFRGRRHGGWRGGRRWGRGWGGWGYPGYVTYIYDNCEECFGLMPDDYQQCMAVRGCLHPMLGLGQEAPTSASIATQEIVARAAGAVAGGVIGLGLGAVGLTWLAYYMFVGRHKNRRVRHNRRRSR